MITWTEFERQQPALADAGKAMFYQHGLGLGFIATVRKDGGPRVHPLCPVISTAGLHVIILPGPKLGDLRRDGRYSLCCELFAPPRQDDGFAVYGRAVEATDDDAKKVVRDKVTADFGEPWPDYDSLTVFELLIDRALLTLTQPNDSLPKGHTIWKDQA
jgi:hypothetical protein